MSATLFLVSRAFRMACSYCTCHMLGQRRMANCSHGDARVAPLLDSRPGEDDPGRRAGGPALAVRVAALAYGAAPGRGLTWSGGTCSLRALNRRSRFAMGRAASTVWSLPTRSWLTPSAPFLTEDPWTRSSPDAAASRCQPGPRRGGSATVSRMQVSILPPRERAPKGRPPIACATAAPDTGCSPV